MTMFAASRPWLPAVLFSSMTLPGPASAQDGVPARPAASPSIESIHEDYQRALMILERQRLDRLGQLASTQPMDRAEAAYQDYFRLAIAKGLYAEAEPGAERVIRSGDSPPSILWLAHLVNMISEADRGAYDESLASLASAVRLKGKDPKAPEEPGRATAIPTAGRAAIVDAYYQRLIQGGRYDIAGRAMRLIAENAEVPAVRDLAERRSRQLGLIGKAAPPIAGADLDGKAFRLEDARGDVVLVVFWATWCLPVARELPWVDQAYRAHHGQGFRVVGINLDSPPDSGTDPRAALPNVRQFLLDNNVPWPNLINGRGDQDHARAFGVAEIPSNVLIGRDGKVTQLDLTGPRLEKAVVEALGLHP